MSYRNTVRDTDHTAGNSLNGNELFALPSAKSSFSQNALEGESARTEYSTNVHFLDHQHELEMGERTSRSLGGLTTFTVSELRSGDDREAASC
jgi:hypothetical protein